MTEFPDDIYAPTSLAQPPADADIDQGEAAGAEPPSSLFRMSKRLGERLRSTRGILKLMN